MRSCCKTALSYSIQYDVHVQIVHTYVLYCVPYYILVQKENSKRSFMAQFTSISDITCPTMCCTTLYSTVLHAPLYMYLFPAAPKKLSFPAVSEGFSSESVMPKGKSLGFLSRVHNHGYLLIFSYCFFWHVVGSRVLTPVFSRKLDELSLPPYYCSTQRNRWFS